MKMAPQVKTKILEADGLDCGMGGRTTAMHKLVKLQVCSVLCLLHKFKLDTALMTMILTGADSSDW